jgi:hypothetical protein
MTKKKNASKPRKLDLSRETLRVLDAGALRQAGGGAYMTAYTTNTKTCTSSSVP